MTPMHFFAYSVFWFSGLNTAFAIWGWIQKDKAMTVFNGFVAVECMVGGVVFAVLA